MEPRAISELFGDRIAVAQAPVRLHFAVIDVQRILEQSVAGKAELLRMKQPLRDWMVLYRAFGFLHSCCHHYHFLGIESFR